MLKYFFPAVFFLALAACLPVRTPDRVSLNEIESGYIATSDSVKLYYRKVGNGTEKVLIPGDFLLFDDFSHLREGRTLVFYDMRNRGRSKPVYGRQKISVFHDIRDLEEVRKFFGFDRMSLIGYSYLGKMAIMYALDHPDRVERIIQMGPVPIKFGTEYPPSLTAADDKPVIDRQALSALRKKREQNFHLTHPGEYCQEEWEITRVRLVGNPANIPGTGESNCDLPNEWPTYLARHFSAHLASMREADITLQRLRNLPVPVLTIHGTKDRNAPYGSGREWARQLGEARLLTVEGAAHRVWVEDPDLVFSSIDAFLDSNWPERAAEVTRAE